MKILAVIDMQKDFINGSLGTKEAEAIVAGVAEKIRNFDGTVVYTRDTHTEDYLDTLEGKKLPVPHCIKGSEGWKIEPELEALRIERHSPVFDKDTFGSVELADFLTGRAKTEKLESIEFVGLCTDICVITNALVAKTVLPGVPVSVDAACCAGVTPQSHRTALEAMKMCQIEIKNDKQEDSV